MRRAFALLLLLSGPALAQTVTSPAPDAVAVTIYRAPDRSPDSKIDTDWLQGYALVTETRTVRLPAGRGVIRFEGVAGGILPESAIISGLPAGVREKNLDADLLSEFSLFARSTGRPVTIRRIDRRTGKAREERGIIRSGPEGAAVVQTAEGFTALDCGKTEDAISFDRVPPGLSAKPTLSVETDSPAAGMAKLTLSYLTWGFDWQANYVATLRADGKGADLFAWVTLASGDPTSFVEAETSVVAGKLERSDEAPDARYDGDGPELSFSCYASQIDELAMPAPPMMSPSAIVDSVVAEDIGKFPDEDIIVTANRASRFAVEEALGDLKLYRVPFATTVAAQSTKQVALLERKAVPLAIVHVAEIEQDRVDRRIELRGRNRKEDGLGLSLPAGPVALFDGGRQLLVAEGALDDNAVGQDVEIKLPETSGQLAVDVEETADNDKTTDYELTVTSALPYPVAFEGKLILDEGQTVTRPSRKLGRKDGAPIWTVQVPANGVVKLRYRVVDVP